VTKQVAYLPLCPGQVQVHVDLTVLPHSHSSVVVLEESPCPRGSSRTNFQVLVLVLESQVLDDDNTAVAYKNIGSIRCKIGNTTPNSVLRSA